jgi:predicted esterase
MKRWLKRIGFGFLALLVVAGVGLYVYSLDAYGPDALAQGVYEANLVQVKGSIHHFDVPNARTGLIYYPGGKVKVQAYAHFADQLRARGVQVFLVEMPLNLAVFDLNAANRVRTQHPEVEHWFIAGHSLGGAMASAHVGSNATAYKGIILLAAYPINDADLPRLIVYGDRDGVLNMTSMEPFLDEALVLRGGNHAYFGNYGEQEGDLSASITPALQQRLTVDAIVEFIQNSCASCQLMP